MAQTLIVESLSTERLILRSWRQTDRTGFARLNADVRVMQFMPGLLSREESDKLVDHIEEHFSKHGFGLYATEFRDTRTFVGFIGLAMPSFDAPFMPAVEIGWRLAADYWGKGLATEGAREVVRHAFQNLGLDGLVSFTVPANVRSRRVMEKLGMHHDPCADFEHPKLPESHCLRPHVLYRLSRADCKSAFQC